MRVGLDSLGRNEQFIHIGVHQPLTVGTFVGGCTVTRHPHSTETTPTGAGERFAGRSKIVVRRAARRRGVCRRLASRPRSVHGHAAGREVVVEPVASAVRSSERARRSRRRQPCSRRTGRRCERDRTAGRRDDSDGHGGSQPAASRLMANVSGASRRALSIRSRRGAVAHDVEGAAMWFAHRRVVATVWPAERMPELVLDEVHRRLVAPLLLKSAAPTYADRRLVEAMHGGAAACARQRWRSRPARWRCAPHRRRRSPLGPPRSTLSVLHRRTPAVRPSQRSSPRRQSRNWTIRRHATASRSTADPRCRESRTAVGPHCQPHRQTQRTRRDCVLMGT